MDKSEADKILLALDGLAANVETVRNLVLGSVKSANSKNLLDMIPDESCQHENSQTVSTMQATNTFCNDCGQMVE